MAVMLALGGILTAVLNGLSGGRLQAWIPWFTTRLLDLATERLPEDRRERFAEEWTSHLNDVLGKIGKVVFAWGCVSAAGEMASLLNYGKPTLNRVLKGYLDFFKRAMGSVNLVGAAVALFLEDTVLRKRRIMRTIIVLGLVGALVGFLVYLPAQRYYAKYTSQAWVLVESQKVPEQMVQPVVSDDLYARINMLKAQATNDSEMRPILTSLFPNKSQSEVDTMLDDMRIQTDMITPFSDLSQAAGSNVRRRPGQSESPGFIVSYTASNAKDAHDVCDAITSKIIDKNLKLIQDNATGTVDVLTQGLEDAKRKLDDVGGRLADFKNHHLGQLPSDQANNLTTLVQLNQEDDKAAQSLNLAQQDKAFYETALSQQLAAWKSTQSSAHPQTLQKQLSDLQAQLIDLQAPHADDHPDVVKTKADIAEVKKRLAEINNGSEQAADASNDKASAMSQPRYGN